MIRVSHPLPRKGTETVTVVIVTDLSVEKSFTPITPQGDGNKTNTNSKTKSKTKRFHTHYPARGRKHKVVASGCWASYTTVSHPLPRKGTETYYKKDHEGQRCLRFTPITPQGDGNLPRGCFLGIYLWWMFHTHYPARGRKHQNKSTKKHNDDHQFHTHYPARGRKRVFYCCCTTAIAPVFHTHYPAWGRKRKRKVEEWRSKSEEIKKERYRISAIEIKLNFKISLSRLRSSSFRL